VGWQKGGTSIKYSKSRLSKQLQGRKRYYCLTFEHTFEFPNDSIWFASTIPYTFSMLFQYVKAIVSDQKEYLDHLKALREAGKKSKQNKQGRVLQE